MSEQFQPVIYTPESEARTPLKMIPAMWHDLLASRELAWRLTVRDISAKYRESVLGLLWAFLPPILAGVVFVFLHNKSIVDFGDVGMPYPVYTFIGTALWQLFVESINLPLRTVTSSRAMLAKINFPREALILSAFYQSLFSLFIKTILLVAIILFFGVDVSYTSILFIVPAILLIWLGLVIGLLLTPLGMLYNDVSSSVIIFTQFLFFITPVVYAVPTTYPYSLLAFLNPVTPYLSAARNILVHGTTDNIGIMFVTTIFLTIFLFIGWYIYRLAMPVLIERISA